MQAVADILSLALAIPVLRRVMKKIPSTEDIQNLPKEAVPIPEGQL